MLARLPSAARGEILPFLSSRWEATEPRRLPGGEAPTSGERECAGLLAERGREGRRGSGEVLATANEQDLIRALLAAMCSCDWMLKSEEDSRFLSRITGRFNWNLGLLRSKAKQAARKLQWALGRAAGMINSAICFPALGFCRSGHVYPSRSSDEG